MSIAETIPGGCYRSPDGSWHNANGEPITPPADVAAAQAASDAAKSPEPVAEDAPAPAAAPAPAPVAVEATDAAVELAEANEIDLATVTGSLKDGKIGVDDVRAAIAARDAEDDGEEPAGDE